MTSNDAYFLLKAREAFSTLRGVDLSEEEFKVQHGNRCYEFTYCSFRVLVVHERMTCVDAALRACGASDDSWIPLHAILRRCRDAEDFDTPYAGGSGEYELALSEVADRLKIATEYLRMHPQVLSDLATVYGQPPEAL